MLWPKHQCQRLSKDVVDDRHDVIVALDSNVRTDIIHMTQPEWHSYYAEKVCVLDQFSQYSGQDILKTGGSALLERELSAIVRPVMQKDVKIPELLRPSLHKGHRTFTSMPQYSVRRMTQFYNGH